MFLVGIGNEMGLPVAAGRYIAVTFKQLCKIAWIDKSAPVGNFVDTVVGGAFFIIFEAKDFFYK